MTYISWALARLFSWIVLFVFIAASDLPSSSFFSLRVFADFFAAMDLPSLSFFALRFFADFDRIAARSLA
jgi:hypothetical protein